MKAIISHFTPQKADGSKIQQKGTEPKKRAPFTRNIIVLAKTPISICRQIFEAKSRIDPNYTRVQFMADCEKAGVKKSTSSKQWLPLGGVRKFSRT